MPIGGVVPTGGIVPTGGLVQNFYEFFPLKKKGD